MRVLTLLAFLAGALCSAKAGTRTQVRLVLSAEAARPGETVLAGVLLLALLLAAGWVIFQVMAQQGRLLLRLETLEARLAEAGLSVAPPAAGTAVLTLAEQDIRARASD